MAITKAALAPGKIGTLELKNRFYMSPMGTGYPTMDGYVTDQLVDYLAERAKGGFGLVGMEFTAVTASGQPPTLACAYDDTYLPGLTKVATAIKENGAKALLQLAHCGRQTFGDPPKGPVVAASAIPCAASGTVGREMTEEEIWETIEAFGDAAVRAVKAGFDAIEIHCAHGYLIQNFLSPYSNKRTDQWGGSFENRSRFAREVMRNIRKKVGPDYPIITRISRCEPIVQDGLQFEDQIKFAQLLEAEGSDCIDVSVGVYSLGLNNNVQKYLIPPLDMPLGLNVDAAAELKKHVKIPVMVVGRINDPIQMENIVAQGKADFLAIGRGSLADPYLPAKFAEGRVDDIIKCMGCMEGCFKKSGIMPITCTRNPNTGNEKALEYKPAEVKKNVVVVGGGVAGLEVATRLKRRGHDVTVIEKTSTLGGQFLLAGAAPKQGEKREAALQMGRIAQRVGVKFIMQTEATPDCVAAMNPDVVVVATGSVEAPSGIAGAEGANVVTAAQILSGVKTAGHKVVVVGGNSKGCEVARFLAVNGHDVQLFETKEGVATDLDWPRMFIYMKEVPEDGVKITTKATVKAVEGDTVVFETEGKTEEVTGVDTVVLATGMQSLDTLSEALKAKGIETYVIGDAKKVSYMIDATIDAAFLAAKI